MAADSVKMLFGEWTLPAPHFIPAKKGGDVRSRLHARTLQHL